MRAIVTFITIALSITTQLLSAQSPMQSSQQAPWWRSNNLRVIQTNLPAYEAATLDPDSLVRDLVDFSANTLIINAGGIMAFYPTALDFQYTNPYMRPNMLGDVIEKCHRQNIHVIVRFDFSRIEEGIYKAHPDWCYISPKGERIVNTNMVVTSVNAPYVQDRAFKIIEEVMDRYPIDGIFLNMPGYQVNDAYQQKYHGIDQNEYDKKRFAAFSGGFPLPIEENKSDSVYQRYLQFKQFTVDDWSRRLYELVHAKSDQIAICTYSDKYVDIIRHESQASPIPYWPYTASDNVNNASHSFPGHIISNSSIQQISFQSRYNAVEPGEVAIRLYENLANGSGLDISLMGDLRGYEDERNFPVIKKIYALHKKFESWFGRYKSPAKIVIIAPGSWPSGLPMQEYRGVLLALKEAHIPFDIIEAAQIGALRETLKSYHLIILPDITTLDSSSIQALRAAIIAGTGCLATNSTLSDNPATLKELFGATIINHSYEGSGNYLQPYPLTLFPRLKGQSMIYWKYNLGLYNFDNADARYLPVLSKGRPGPPEIIGGHDSTGFYAMGVKLHGPAKTKAILLPENIGRLYYIQGYQQHKNILLDAIAYAYPAATQIIQTNAPARVETILQQFISLFQSSSSPSSSPQSTSHPSFPSGLILHLVNLTGFSGNTYFNPLPLYNLTFHIACPFKPSQVSTLTDNRTLPFSWHNGFLDLQINTLSDYQAVIIRQK